MTLDMADWAPKRDSGIDDQALLTWCEGNSCCLMLQRLRFCNHRNVTQQLCQSTGRDDLRDVAHTMMSSSGQPTRAGDISQKERERGIAELRSHTIQEN